MATEMDSLVEKLKMLDPRRRSGSRTPSRTPSKTPNKSPKDSPKYRNKSYSIVSLSEVTEGSLQVWRALPEKIRQDPSLASFRQEHDRRLHGKSAWRLLSAGWFRRKDRTRLQVVIAQGDIHVGCGSNNHSHIIIKTVVWRASTL